MLTLAADIYRINLDKNNFCGDDPITITDVRLLAWCSKFKNLKALKKKINKLMAVVWNPECHTIFAYQKMK